MSTAAIRPQLDAAKARLEDYSANLPAQIETNIQNASTPFMEKLAGNVAQLKQDFLPRYFNEPLAMGTSEADLSPTQKLTMMGRSLGQFSGDIGKQQSILDYYGGSLKDMVGKAQEQAKYEATLAQQMYQNLFNEYQLANANEQAEADRRAAAARSSGGGSSNSLGDLLGLLRKDDSIDYNKLTSSQGGQSKPPVNTTTSGVNSSNAYMSQAPKGNDYTPISQIKKPVSLPPMNSITSNLFKKF